MCYELDSRMSTYHRDHASTVVPCACQPPGLVNPLSAQEIDRIKVLTTPSAIYTKVVAYADIAEPNVRLVCCD